MKIVLSPNPHRDRGLKAACTAERILRSAGAEVSICLPFSVKPGQRSELPKHMIFKELKAELKGADMLICFGGDGTILHAAQDAIPHKVPILGVNMGSVGFMAEVEHGELSLLPKVLTGDYTLEERMMLDISVIRGGRSVYQSTALNDAVITKGAVARIADLSVYSDGVLLSDFGGDGVIVATPTGSTAYSMAAGGPIVEPTAENLIITPICAHALQAKSFVLDRDRVVEVTVQKNSKKDVFLSADGGKAFRVQSGDRVTVHRSKYRTKLVRIKGESFYSVVWKKLGKGV